MVIQDSEDTAWNEHVGLVVFRRTRRSPAANVALAGVSTYEHEQPACVMRKRSPPTSILEGAEVVVAWRNDERDRAAAGARWLVITQPSSATAFQEQEAPLAMAGRRRSLQRRRRRRRATV
jgi:hypothetical protein